MRKVSYVLVPGAGGAAWYWHRLVPELRERGQDAIAVDLPAADDEAGLAEYADTIVRATNGRSGVVLVAQSLAGFSAPIACERAPVDLLILLNAMVPVPGETPGEWWGNTGQPRARAEYAKRQGRTITDEIDILEDLFHDVPEEVKAEAFSQEEPRQSNTPFGQAWPLERWPDVATRLIQARDDRLFPLEFQQRVAKERLGTQVDEVVPGGHLVALSRPRELAEALEAATRKQAASE